jgi:TP901 family phage tail tape measure protein
VAAFAGLSVKAAVDYDQAFTRIAAVSNASAKSVEKWKEEVKGLAGTTARAPQELAEALYFLASAGLNASEIMPTLKASAKAAASGLGETEDIARITANALNAYAGSGLKAADVTDILVAAVREGTAAP